MEITADHKALAKYLKSLWGESPRVFTHADTLDRARIAIMTAADQLQRGVNSYATIGLSDLDLKLVSDGLPVRAELLMACAAAYEFGPNILATCAFEAINDGAPIRPDAILFNVIREYYPACSMSNVLLQNPYLWDIETQRFETKTVAWLLAVPISESETQFATAEGVPALQSLFEQHDIDIFTFDRDPVV